MNQKEIKYYFYDQYYLNWSKYILILLMIISPFIFFVSNIENNDYFIFSYSLILGNTVLSSFRTINSKIKNGQIYLILGMGIRFKLFIIFFTLENLLFSFILYFPIYKFDYRYIFTILIWIFFLTTSWIFVARIIFPKIKSFKTFNITFIILSSLFLTIDPLLKFLLETSSVEMLNSFGNYQIIIFSTLALSSLILNKKTFWLNLNWVGWDK